MFIQLCERRLYGAVDFGSDIPISIVISCSSPKYHYVSAFIVIITILVVVVVVVAIVIIAVTIMAAF